MLEVNTAILCASVPALKPIFSWKKIRDVRRPNTSPGRIDDPFNLDLQKKQGMFSRKPSDASLYPDLETFNLTQLSSGRSPPGSPTSKKDGNRSRPSSSTDSEMHEGNFESSLQRQTSFNMV